MKREENSRQEHDRLLREAIAKRIIDDLESLDFIQYISETKKFYKYLFSDESTPEDRGYKISPKGLYVKIRDLREESNSPTIVVVSQIEWELMGWFITPEFRHSAIGPDKHLWRNDALNYSSVGFNIEASRQYNVETGKPEFVVGQIVNDLDSIKVNGTVKNDG